MKVEKHSTESGQAIVYLVLGLVVFFGFVALAVDGGMVLADRRHAQNAADASSLAGGAEAAYYIDGNLDTACNEDYYWSCDNYIANNAIVTAEASAIDRAGTNDFVIDHDTGDNNGVVATCTAGTNNYLDVTVDISSTTPSNILQILSTDALQNVVEAVTRIYPGKPVAFGNAIVALNPEHCSDPGSQGLIIGGSSTIHVTGGDLFSNGCLRQNGNAMTVTLGTDDYAWGHQLFKIDPDNWEPNDPDTTNRTLSTNDYMINAPDCSHPDAHHIDGDTLKHDLQSGPVTLDPGLWCINGDVSILSSNKLTGIGITIRMVTGKFIVAGGADVELSAPTGYASPAIEGVLIYMGDNSAVVTLNGGQTSFYRGLIYAPKSYVTLTGTGGNTYGDPDNPAQVIGWDVEFTGDSDLYLQYKGCKGYKIPTRIELNK